jgi:RND family efflux transporter MFP subunit
VDPKSRKFRVKIKIPNPDFKLRGGMSARVNITEQEKRDVLRIPKKALMVKQGQVTVYVLEEGVARARSVELGVSDDQWVEVGDGINEGDQVVVEGIYALTDGVKAKIIQ